MTASKLDGDSFVAPSVANWDGFILPNGRKMYRRHFSGTISSISANAQNTQSLNTTPFSGDYDIFSVSPATSKWEVVPKLTTLGSTVGSVVEVGFFNTTGSTQSSVSWSVTLVLIEGA